MTALDKVRAAAAKLTAETGCPVEVEFEPKATWDDYCTVALYLPDGWEFKASECRTSLSPSKSLTAAAAMAIRDLRQGIRQLPR